MHVKKTASMLFLAAITGVSLVACGSYGESHDHNAPAPAYDIHAVWVRIQSPGNYPTVIRACVPGKTVNGVVTFDGIYENTDGQNSTEVIANDPACDGSQYGAGVNTAANLP